VAGRDVEHRFLRGIEGPGDGSDRSGISAPGDGLAFGVEHAERLDALRADLGVQQAGEIRGLAGASRLGDVTGDRPAEGLCARFPDLLEREARVRRYRDEQRHERQQHQPAEQEQDLEA
jgi:hypothetical protein